MKWLLNKKVVSIILFLFGAAMMVACGGGGGGGGGSTTIATETIVITSISFTPLTAASFSEQDTTTIVTFTGAGEKLTGGTITWTIGTFTKTATVAGSGTSPLIVGTKLIFQALQGAAQVKIEIKDSATNTLAIKYIDITIT